MVEGVTEPEVDLNKVKEFLMKNPEFLIGLAMVSFGIMAQKGERPAHLKDMPPIHPRTAGPWRGKGSFGHSFGPNKVTHK